MDTDILRSIIVKLQQRVKAKTETLLIKIKVHRGYPLNEEEDIRTEMGRMKQEQEKTWITPPSWTIYQWSEVSKTKSVINTTKQTTWTQTVRNRIRQKAGEDQAYRAYEKGVEKWRKDHIPRKGKRNISGEGQELLEDKEIWRNETALHGAVYESRKRERSNEDGLFMAHQKGPITSTFTANWFLWDLGGTETRTVGRMDEVDLGQITRPKENATSELPHIPNERLDPQDHEGKRIRQMRPM